MMLLKITIILWILTIVVRTLAKASLNSRDDFDKWIGKYSITTIILLILNLLLSIAAVVMTIITVIKW